MIYPSTTLSISHLLAKRTNPANPRGTLRGPAITTKEVAVRTTAAQSVVQIHEVGAQQGSVTTPVETSAAAVRRRVLAGLGRNLIQ